MYDLKTYVLGNCLRCFFEGKFASVDEAWRVLSARFNKSFPSENGRHVYMHVNEQNAYGLMDWTKCKEGVTSMETVSDEEILKVTYSHHYW